MTIMSNVMDYTLIWILLRYYLEENDDHVGYGDRPISGLVTPGLPPSSRSDDIQRDSLRNLFESIAGKDMEVDWMELKRVLDHSMRDDLPKVSFNQHQRFDEKSYPIQNGQSAGNSGEGGACGLISLICGPFLKGTPFEEQLGLNDQSNKGLMSDNQTGDGIFDSPVIAESNGFSKDVCRSMVAMLDTDQSGKLGFEEFSALMSDIAKWKAVFKVYDVEHQGRIDGFQLREALNSAGYHLNNHVLNALSHRYSSRDGKIAFDDFLMCAVKIKTYIEMFKERDTGKNNTATFTLEEWIERTICS